MTEQGIIERFTALPAAGVLGLEEVGALWNEPVPLDVLLELQDTVAAGNTVDGTAGAIAYTRDPQGWVARATEAAGTDPTDTFSGPPYEGSPLGPLELRILRAMVQAPTAPAEELARLSGLSPKTARSRRDLLLREGAVHVKPRIRGDRSGAIACHLHITCSREQAPAILKALQEAAVIDHDGEVLCTIARASNLREQAERFAAVRAAGAEEVRVVQDHDLVFKDDVLLGLVDDAIARWR